ncbi:hypothetical protein [Psychromonas sp. KJ10-2]|uniref:hypothetical protein n=1 Tax=Psychromonas sp. KJ10-2 TaxID=3391822 RepID=UPI0039B62C24
MNIRRELKEQAKEILNTSDEGILNDVDVYYKVLKGTSVFTTLHDRVKNIKSSLLFNHEIIEKLRDAALLLESYDMRTSLELMMMAQKFRPDGALISHKIAEYKVKLKD